MAEKWKADPIVFELVKNALASIADEMAVTVVRTARSFVVKEAMDFSTGVCDPRGELVAQGLCLPLHMGSFPCAMEAMLAEFGGGVQPGDMYALNDPYTGGSHLPDVFIAKPVFLDETLIGYCMTTAHQTDIGGRVAGGNACDSTEIYQEGLRLPPVKLYDRGELNSTLVRLIRQNVRVPDRVMGDIMAEVSACLRGEQELLALARRYGAEALHRYMEELLDYSERLTRQELKALPDGEWTFADYIDDDGIDPDPIRIHVTLVKRGPELVADFTGTSRQVKGAINVPFSFAQSAVYACVRSVLDPSIPNNGGFFRPITVVAPSGSFVNCVPPAAVGARGLGGIRTSEVVFGALAQMLPDRVFACESAGDTGVTIAGYYPDGRAFVHLEFIYGTWGGGPDRDGMDANSCLPINYSNTPAEVVEREQPLMIEEYGLVPDSGGPGRFRGGLGMVRSYRLVGVDEAVLQVRADRHKFRPYGLWGGKPGAPSRNVLNPDEDGRMLPSKFLRTLKRDEVFQHWMSGGGGWGDPLERDPERVRDDVVNEKMTPEHARTEYGVVITPDFRVDREATAKLRQSILERNEA